MADVFSFPEKKASPPQKPKFSELQVERQHLTRKMLDLIRSKNEAMARFNNDIQLLSLEMVKVIGRQSEIDELMAQHIEVEIRD